jgi:hypothetical protein
VKPFDGRHRWGPPENDGARIKRTCGACGRTESYEVLISESLIGQIVGVITMPNPYRALVR